MYDSIIIGGGPAGLQAALTLGRMHRDVLVIDSGEYRNATVEHAHNMITLDGVPPAQIRAQAFADIQAYDTVEFAGDRVDRVEQSDGGFLLTLGDRQERARTVILATGVRDVLPEAPGLAEVWGREAANCPFCHGHEFAGRRVALIGMGDHAEAIAGMLRPVVAESIVLDAVTRVERVSTPDGHGLRLGLPSGDSLDVAGVFVRSDFVQSAPFAEQLGLDLLPTGCIEVDFFGHTSMPGVYAAGDLASRAELPMPMASVLAAAAAGQMAAATCVRELAMQVVPAQTT